MKTKFQEIELKYHATWIPLPDFHKFCKAKAESEYIEASGFDHFYTNPGETNKFFRLRMGPDIIQLTFKEKTETKNNFIRNEDNIDLAPGTTRDQVESLLKKVGYEYDFSLFKSCFIYKFDYYTYVYYVVYDTYMREVGRFVEIEMSEDRDWVTEQEAWNELVLLEKLSKDLGVTPQSRIKRSLYELFKK